MDKTQLLELAPHYLALVILIFAVLTVVRLFAGGTSLWLELIIAGATAFLYRPLMVRLGLAPSMWD
jgi:hypothetical protein